MNICILDDNSEKIARITDLLVHSCGIPNEEISVAGNLASGRKALAETRFDLLILDLVVPRSLNGEPEQGAGVDFLREIHEGKRLFKPRQVVGLTAFTELVNRETVTFTSFTWTLLYYGVDSKVWEDRLKGKVEYCLSLLEEEANARTSEFDFDFAIVTALHSPEFLAVLNLPVDWKNRSCVGDYTEYFTGIVNEKGISSVPRRVVAASAYNMGMSAASVLTSKICAHFKPRMILMCGIAAGVRGRAELGDIIVADATWDYGSGKIVVDSGNQVFQPDPKYITISPCVNQVMERLCAQKKFVADIMNRWLFKSELHSTLEARVGPMASGSSVIQDASVVQRIVSGNRKLLGLEMEAFGMYFTAHNWIKPCPKFLSVKAVCDFADLEKNDKAHSYAAFSSAEFAFELMKSGELANCIGAH